MKLSPKNVYHHLKDLDGDQEVEISAFYRQLAQDVLADPDVSLIMRLAISDRLLRANHQLELRTVTENDSY